MHLSSGKLYTQTTTGHIEYGLVAFEYGEKPLTNKPRRTLRGSTAKDAWILSKSFHALASDS